jgi:hypothetical protein
MTGKAAATDRSDDQTVVRVSRLPKEAASGVLATDPRGALGTETGEVAPSVVHAATSDENRRRHRRRISTCR